jgi:hypothetical protein
MFRFADAVLRDTSVLTRIQELIASSAHALASTAILSRDQTTVLCFGAGLYTDSNIYPTRETNIDLIRASLSQEHCLPYFCSWVFTL